MCAYRVIHLELDEQKVLSAHQVSGEMLTACALKAVRLYAESHPRPTQVNAIQAAEMLGLSAQTVRKMIKQGRIALNPLGMIPVSEIDRVLSVRE